MGKCRRPPTHHPSHVPLMVYPRLLDAGVVTVGKFLRTRGKLVSWRSRSNSCFFSLAVTGFKEHDFKILETHAFRAGSTQEDLNPGKF